MENTGDISKLELSTDGGDTDANVQESKSVEEAKPVSLISFDDDDDTSLPQTSTAVILQQHKQDPPDVVELDCDADPPTTSKVSCQSNWPDLLGDTPPRGWLAKEEEDSTSSASTSTVVDESQFDKSKTEPTPFPIERWEGEGTKAKDGTISIEGEKEKVEVITVTEDWAGVNTETSSANVPTTCSSTVSSASSVMLQEYHLKWIHWKGLDTPIVTQNANGPCPLLALINILLLRRNITLPRMVELITATQLMEYLCDFIIKNAPKNLPPSTRVNYEQNLQDAMNVLPKLATGLDVNVKFTGISDFEYTPECIVFDLLNISLYHGWLVDPAEKEMSRILNNLSYNQLVDKIIMANGTTDDSLKSDMFIAEEFLNQTASQLTHYGLKQLIHNVKEEELCTLFRNNHFITLYKLKGSLYQLVTDQGFLTESNVVWETLHNIEGDSQFVDGNFMLAPPRASILPARTEPVANKQQQIDQDYLIALTLQEEQKQEWEQDSKNESNSQLVESNQRKAPLEPKLQERIGSSSTEEISPTLSSCSQLSTLSGDAELARCLQEQEDRLFAESEQQRQQHYSGHNQTRLTNAPAPRGYPSGDPPSTRPYANRGQALLNRNPPGGAPTSTSRHARHNPQALPSGSGQARASGNSGSTSSEAKDKSKCCLM